MRTVGDAEYRTFVVALWALVGAARDRSEHQREAAAEAIAALEAARGAEAFVMLHEQDGVVHVNGRQLQLGVDVFAAAFGISSMLRDRNCGELLFDANADGESLLAWARCWTAEDAPAADLDQQLVAAGAAGIHASRRSVDCEPTLPLRRRSARPDASDSRLRSVFLQHQLIAATPVTGLVPPVLAKVVVAAVVDRLLAVPGGLEPLMLLQRDEALLRRSLHVAVLTVVLARAAGWPDERLADMGTAGLLCDIGEILEPDSPGVAGFSWLLDRGCDDFWLRCAVVARTWRDAHGASSIETGAGNAAAAAIVRTAAELEGLLRGDGGRDLPAIAKALHRRAKAGAFPHEFVDVAEAALAAVAD